MDGAVRGQSLGSSDSRPRLERSSGRALHRVSQMEVWTEVEEVILLGLRGQMRMQQQFRWGQMATLTLVPTWVSELPGNRNRASLLLCFLLQS